MTDHPEHPTDTSSDEERSAPISTVEQPPGEATGAASPAPDERPAVAGTEPVPPSSPEPSATPAGEAAQPSVEAAPAVIPAPAETAAADAASPVADSPAPETAAADAGQPAPSGQSGAAGPRSGGQREPRKRPERRRRPSPAQRHRNAFYAKLSELRRQDEAEQQGRLEGPTAEDTAAAEAQSSTPPPVPEPQQQQQQQPGQQGRAQQPGRAQARVRAAVERVGGDETVREALAPKQRADGQTMKWSAVCCDCAQGMSPGDPIFTAWARLAVTPVREIKGLVDPRDARDSRNRRGGPRRGGQGNRPWRDGGGYAGAEDMRQHGRDGSLTTRIRILDMSVSSKDREQSRDEGQAKLREAAERLSRIQAERA